MSEPTFADVDALVGPATPHFAYQLRARVRELVRDLPEEHEVRKYVEEKILPVNPFQTLDRSGVGQLVQMAAQKGRAANPEIELGICGEHGGDPDSIAFCHQTGLDYVSCSPFRVPIARLAAAQAALQRTGPADK